jgi:hypothetical protein
MKKFTLFMLMMLSVFSITTAQVVEDFETIRLNYMLGGAEDLSTLEIVANPDPTGINTSGMVCKYVRDKDGVPWGGFWSALAISVDVTTNKYVHVKVWKPRISPVKFKLEGGAAGNLEAPSMAPHATTGAWEELVFDFTSKTGTYPTIAFMPDFEDPLTLTSDMVMYFDDIIVNNDPTVGSAAVTVIENFEHIGLNYMLGGAEDVSSMSIVRNPDRSGVNMSDLVVKYVRDKDGVPWGGFWSSLPTPVDVTVNKYVHVKVWKPRISPVKFKLEGGTAGNLEAPSMSPQTLTGMWQDIVFDFTSKTGTYPVIAFMPDFEDPLTLTEDIVIYFDDIIVNNDPNPIIPTSQVINVNMKGSGLAAAQKVYIAGDFGGDYGSWAGPGSNAKCEMTDPDADSIYTISMDIAVGTYHFKFFKGSGWDGGEWTGDPNRILVVTVFTPVTYKWGDKSSNVDVVPWSEQVHAYPVPFGNELTINALAGVKTVVVTSAFGQQVARYENVAPGLTTINTSQLAAGMYFVTFINRSGQMITKKILKTNN